MRRENTADRASPSVWVLEWTHGGPESKPHLETNPPTWAYSRSAALSLKNDEWENKYLCCKLPNLEIVLQHYFGNSSLGHFL